MLCERALQEFAEKDQAGKAVSYNGKVLLGRSVRVLPEAKRHTPRGGEAKGDALSAPAVEVRAGS